MVRPTPSGRNLHSMKEKESAGVGGGRLLVAQLIYSTLLLIITADVVH